jgi:hypothetical protein
MATVDGHDQKGRFTPGHKLARGRPLGSPNKPLQPYFEDDPQSATAVRFRDLLTGIVNDLGGESELSTGQLQLARRCAWISVQCEAMERRKPEAFNVAAYASLTGRLNQTLSLLGLKRQPRDVTPTLRDYLDAARRPDAEEEHCG